VDITFLISGFRFLIFMEYFTPAIVLGKNDVKEYDRFFSLYTRNLGKTIVLAKGVRRSQSKMAGYLEPFALLAVKIVSGRGGNKLSNVETIKRYQNINKDLELIKLASHCLALVNDFVKEGSCDLGILKLLNQILEILNLEKKNLAEKKFLVNVFKLQLASHLGYQPELYHCLICRKKVEPQDNGFDFLKGGLICSHCRGSEIDITAEEIKILRLISTKELDFFLQKKISRDLMSQGEKIISQFIEAVKG